MKVLILGAGGIGGYFGARLQAAGGDVSFLVREARAEQLRADGLRVSSPLGDSHFIPRVLTADTLTGDFDAVLLTCKSYDLDSALAAIAPAMGPQTAVVPLLNGIRHLEVLDARFGRERVLGGLAFISVTLAADGGIQHMGNFHRLMVGARQPSPPACLAPLAELLGRTGVEFTLSPSIEQDMWNKFVFIASMAGATCAMRASLGDILAVAGGEDFIRGLLDECCRVAAAQGYPIPAGPLENYRNQLTDHKSALKASMLRDIERGGAIEHEHIVGDMLRRGQTAGLATPCLGFAYAHLCAYERSRSAV